MPLHTIGDLRKTFKRMLKYTNNLELKSTTFSFADTLSNEDTLSSPEAKKRPSPQALLKEVTWRSGARVL